MRKVNNYKDYYKLPLHNDEYGRYVWAENGTMTLMFDSRVSKEDREKVVNTLNGKDKNKIPHLRKEGVDFYDGDKYIFCVRGWGGLTGTGALNLAEHKAVKIQDDFCDFILKTLS